MRRRPIHIGSENQKCFTFELIKVWLGWSQAIGHAPLLTVEVLAFPNRGHSNSTVLGNDDSTTWVASADPKLCGLINTSKSETRVVLISYLGQIRIGKFRETWSRKQQNWTGSSVFLTVFLMKWNLFPYESLIFLLFKIVS